MAAVGAVELINNGNYSSGAEERALVNFVVWRQTSDDERLRRPEKYPNLL